MSSLRFQSSRARRPFCILKVLGDVLDGGEVRFVEATKTLQTARRRIRTLGESCPGEFVIYNQQTGERMSIEGGVDVPPRGCEYSWRRASHHSRHGS